jgi:hypothetical protein
MKQLQYREATLLDDTTAPFKVYAEKTIVTKEMRAVQANPGKALGDGRNWQTRIVDTIQYPHLAL